ncbi:PD40 domain-containing protein [Dyella marensis]|uniref:TolB family protein n=1 Tax=Dyella marensis TaxID=500610 RepID=UPI0031E1D10E
MRRLLPLAFLLTFGGTAAATDNPTAAALFAPGVISGAGDEGPAAFLPDGNTVYFSRGSSDHEHYAILVSQRTGQGWSEPRTAPFSGRWRDADPAMSPDGSFLVFASNRPADGKGAVLDTVMGGKSYPGRGMNLWRVARQGQGWGAPERLPDTVNTCHSVFAPDVGPDGTLYYIGCGADGQLRLLRSVHKDGRYQAAEPVAFGADDLTVRDPAIAHDGSFMVASIKSAKTQPYRLAIAFATPQGWSTPQDLGDAVNGGTHAMGAQLGADGRTLYFVSDRRVPGEQADWNKDGDNLWQVSLAPWLDAHARDGAPVAGPWDRAQDASPAFGPGDRSVVFTRQVDKTYRLFFSSRDGGRWSVPQPLPFSTQWQDIEPAMAPDGASLVFISNRPEHDGGAALDGVFDGQRFPGRGGNLWQVARGKDGWGTPQRIAALLNTNSSVFAPALAADGTLYFMRTDPDANGKGAFRLFRSRNVHGQYQAPQPLPFSDGVTGDFDPAVAPDQSFIVFSSKRAPAGPAGSELFIAFARGEGWSTPQPLGLTGIEARLSSDHATLYFNAPDRRVHAFDLRGWLAGHSAVADVARARNP